MRVEREADCWKIIYEDSSIRRVGVGVGAADSVSPHITCSHNAQLLVWQLLTMHVYGCTVLFSLGQSCSVTVKGKPLQLVLFFFFFFHRVIFFWYVVGHCTELGIYFRMHKSSSGPHVTD